MNFDDILKAVVDGYTEAIVSEIQRPFYGFPDTRTDEEKAAQRAALEEQRAEWQAALDSFMVEFTELMERHPAIRFYDYGYETEGVEVTAGSVSVRLVDGRVGGDQP